MTDGLIFQQKIDLPYQYTVGAAQRAFLRGLAEGKLLASTDGSRRYVPARPFAPDIPRLASPVVTNAVAGELTLCASRR